MLDRYENGDCQKEREFHPTLTDGYVAFKSTQPTGNRFSLPRAHVCCMMEYRIGYKKITWQKGPNAKRGENASEVPYRGYAMQEITHPCDIRHRGHGYSGKAGLAERSNN